MATCPECDADLPVDEDVLEEGDPVECDECGTSFVVTGTEPLELELAEDDEDEDEDEEDEEDEDFEEDDGLEDDEDDEEGDFEE